MMVVVLQVEDLKAQLEDSECLRLDLQVQLATVGHQQQKVRHSLSRS